MIGIAATATGVFAAMLVALLTGGMPRFQRGPRRVGTGSPGRSGPSRRLEGLLARAGSPRSVRSVVLGSVALATAAAVVSAAATGLPSLAVVPGVLAGAAPMVVLRRRALARAREVRAAWPDALAQISGSVRAGRPLSHALVDVSLTGPEALRGPLAGLAARIHAVGMVAALHAVADVVADPVTDRVVEVLALASDEGGRVVVDVLDDLASGIAADVAASEEVETLSLEGRLNARLVFALPWVVLVVMAGREGPFRSFYASPAGSGVILLGAVLSLIGVLVVGRLSAIPSEPRVLRPGEDA